MLFVDVVDVKAYNWVLERARSLFLLLGLSRKVDVLLLKPACSAEQVCFSSYCDNGNGEQTGWCRFSPCSVQVNLPTRFLSAGASFIFTTDLNTLVLTASDLHVY